MEYESASIESTLPRSELLDHARSRLISKIPDSGLGTHEVDEHLRLDIVPALSKSSASPNYYGFVTGGATPAAALADHLVTDHDQNVAVHLPDETVATDVEDCGLRMLCQLLDLDPEAWQHRTLTTGATASNILGLACGRQYVLQEATRRNGREPMSAAENGMQRAMSAAGVEDVQILTTVPHSSLRKAAAIVGLGRSSVIDVSATETPHRFDMSRLLERLQKPKTVSVIVISCSEVNAGLFATNGEDMSAIRELCDDHGAWIHVDGAFGLLARVLPKTDAYQCILAGVEGVHLADSITGDAHKLLNVPYDCGFFLSRHLSVGLEVFHNPNAAYLNPSSSASSAIQSPLNVGIENSRRFRALPLYATLAAYGRRGYADMLERQIGLSRAIAEFIQATPGYELLPLAGGGEEAHTRLRRVYMIVIFRAADDRVNAGLVRRINSTRRIYVSGTVWDGRPATRFAVANWQVDVARDIKVIKDVLSEALGSCIRK